MRAWIECEDGRVKEHTYCAGCGQDAGLAMRACSNPRMVNCDGGTEVSLVREAFCETHKAQWYDDGDETEGCCWEAWANWWIAWGQKRSEPEYACVRGSRWVEGQDE